MTGRAGTRYNKAHLPGSSSTPEKMNTSRKIPFLLLPTMLILLTALWAGLLRMGWHWPAPTTWAGMHGVLMIPAFFGALIALERAVALQKGWPYLAPILQGLGGLTLLLGGPLSLAALLFLAGSALFLAVFVPILRQHVAIYTLLMGIATAALTLGNLLWSLGWPVYRLVQWWIAFLVLTIAAERLELGRLTRVPRAATWAFVTTAALILGGALAASCNLSLAAPILTGLGYLTLALWLLRYDVARKTVRKSGLPRFAAVCLLSGYLWLGVSGLWILLSGPAIAGYNYDAPLHTVLIGFVFSMIFGHAPIILPALLGRMAVFHPRLYAPLVGLHISLALRILGDLLQQAVLWRWGGLLNAIFILLFFAFMALTMHNAQKTSGGQPAR